MFLKSIKNDWNAPWSWSCKEEEVLSDQRFQPSRQLFFMSLRKKPWISRQFKNFHGKSNEGSDGLFLCILFFYCHYNLWVPGLWMNRGVPSADRKNGIRTLIRWPEKPRKGWMKGWNPIWNLRFKGDNNYTCIFIEFNLRWNLEISF